MKITKHGVFGFILGLVIASSVGVIAYSINAKDIAFESKNEEFEATNVQDAIDELYKTSNDNNNLVGEYNKVICVAKIFTTGNGYDVSLEEIGDSGNDIYIFQGFNSTVSEANVGDIYDASFIRADSVFNSTLSFQGRFAGQTQYKVTMNGNSFHFPYLSSYRYGALFRVIK